MPVPQCVLWGSRASAHVPHDPTAGAWRYGNERTDWGVSSLEGPALLGYNLCPWQRLGRRPDAGAGRQVGQRVQGAGRVLGPLSGQFSPQSGPGQGQGPTAYQPVPDQEQAAGYLTARPW